MFYLLTLPLGLRDFVSGVISCWSASYPAELTASFVAFLDEVSQGVEARLFDRGFIPSPTEPTASSSSSDNRKSKSWQEALHASLDSQMVLVVEHLAHLRRVTGRNATSRAKLGGLRSRFKVSEALFSDQQFNAKLTSVLHDFHLGHLFSTTDPTADSDARRNSTSHRREEAEEDGEIDEDGEVELESGGPSFAFGKREREEEEISNPKRRKV